MKKSVFSENEVLTVGFEFVFNINLVAIIHLMKIKIKNAKSFSSKNFLKM